MGQILYDIISQSLNFVGGCNLRLEVAQSIHDNLTPSSGKGPSELINWPLANKLNSQTADFLPLDIK